MLPALIYFLLDDDTHSLCPFGLHPPRGEMLCQQLLLMNRSQDTIVLHIQR